MELGLHIADFTWNGGPAALGPNLAKHARYGYGDHGDYYSRYRGYYGAGTETPANAQRPALTLAKR